MRWLLQRCMIQFLNPSPTLVQGRFLDSSISSFIIRCLMGKENFFHTFDDPAIWRYCSMARWQPRLILPASCLAPFLKLLIFVK
jgi:hypothetical protein